MENYELCEKLVQKTGVSYAQAKDALEKNNWDVLDAMIFMEEEGIIPSAGGSYSCGSGENSDNTQRKNYQDGADGSPKQEHGPGKQTYSQEKQERRNNAKEEAKSFLRKIGDFLSRNRVTAFNNVGKEVLNVPVWIAILVFICTFWVTTILILFSFTKGWQYRFSGPELGKDGVNKAADTVGNAVYQAGQGIKSSFEDKKSSGDCQEADCGSGNN